MLDLTEDIEIFEDIKIFVVIFSAVLGASLGSFLNVVAHRTIQGRSWWGDERSRCEKCGHVLGFSELIPIFSWIFLKGRCKKCGSEISVRYILVEIVMALLFSIIGFKYGISWAGLTAYVGTCGIILNSLTDIESGDIFDMFALSFGIFGMIIRIAGESEALLDGFSGAILGWGIFAFIIILSRGGMGWGDANFMGGMGAILGWKLTILAVYVGFMAGGIFVLFLLLIGRIHWGKGESVPLVPFLGIGSFIALIFGSEILNFLSERFLFLGYQIFNTSWPF